MASGVDLRPVRSILAVATVTTRSLDAACRAAAAALGVTGIGVTVALPGTLRAVVASSCQVARLLEEAQLTVAEGPCTVATATGQPVTVADLSDAAETRWPMLVRYLTDFPVRAVVALPLIPIGVLRGGRALGSMDCVSARPHGLDDVDVPALGAVAGLIADAVLRLRTVGTDTTDPFRGSWDQLHQATGMVMNALGLTALDALDTLRARAVTHGELLGELAADVLTGREAADLPDD